MEEDVQILEEGRKQGSRKWHSEESREFCSSANTIWVMKNKRICVKQNKNAHRALGECPERNKQLGISRRGTEYNIKMGLNEMV